MDRALLAPWNKAVFGNQEKYSALAAATLGRSDLVVTFDDYTLGSSTPIGQANSNIGGGFCTLNISGESSGIGFLLHISSATANNQGGVWSLTAAAYAGGRPWYHACRFRLNGAADNNTQAGVYLRDNSTGQFIGPGVRKTLVANNFCFIHSGGTAAIDSGIPLDTSYHVFEMWGFGTSTLYTRADGVALAPAVMGTPLSATGACGPYSFSNNGATAADFRMTVDWYLIAGV